MNLLQILLALMTSNNSVESVSQQSGVSSDKVKKLLLLAIPLLIRYMTQNASSQNGALSLFSALGQHNRQGDMSRMIATADKDDGSKIIGHILGGDNDRVVRSLASESGLNIAQVAKILAIIAPALLSGLSAATSSQKEDMSGLFGLFGGSAPAQQQKPSGLGLLSSLFGGGQQAESSFNGSDLLKALALIAMMKK